VQDITSLIQEEKGKEILVRIYEMCILSNVLSRPSFEELAKVIANR